jgi:LysM repeat protein
MKPRYCWFGLAIFAALVLATTSGCARAPEDTPTPEAISLIIVEPTLAPPPPTPAAVEAAPQPAVAAAPPEELAAAPAAPVPAEPPVPGQGGTCISGFIVDRYHQARGAGWNVTATPVEGTPTTRGADANGRFRFDGLAGGTWTVQLEVQAGWQPFTLASFPVTLSGSGGNCAEVRFKVEALPCLEVTKLDASGWVGIPGWGMTATQGSTTLTEVTDWQGKCRFLNLAPGTWTVEEESKVGWTPVAGYSSKQSIKLDSPRTPGACQSLTFVNQQIDKGCIEVRKTDAAGNPLSGWKFTLKRDDGTQPSVSRITDATGHATFAGLALGQWTVQEEIKAWWRPLDPTEQKVNLQEPGPCLLVTFRNEAQGCIDGYKINHLDQGLSGWTIKARDEATGEEVTDVTDEKGYFQLPLRPGTWKVSEVMQTGWQPVTPSELEVTVPKPARVPPECQHVRFKNKTELACVDVFKKDAADGTGLPGWEITVRPAYGGTPVVSTTDGTGFVRFNGLTPGTYVVSEKVQDGWVAVTPQSQQLTLQASGSCSVVTFKNCQATAPWYGGCRFTHTVTWGNTLYSLARRYGTTVAAIKHANGLSSDLIRVGQKLCIP